MVGMYRMSNILYTYGTLRPKRQEFPVYYFVKGVLYDLGRFPGIKLGGEDFVVCGKVTVKDWGPVDRYEGYDPDDHERSLYIRVPYLDGFIYEFNRPVDGYPVIPGGDWAKHHAEQSQYG